MIELSSKRLHIREITADDLAKVIPCYLSNPEVVRRQEGSEGEVGRYDLERWQRDWYLAQLMPGRHMLACYLQENGEAVGFIDYLEENEDDGKPWLGQLMISKAYQRQGLASEALERLIEHFHSEYGWPHIRASVFHEDRPACAFLEHNDFRTTHQAPKDWRLPGGVQRFMLLEREL